MAGKGKRPQRTQVDAPKASKPPIVPSVVSAHEAYGLLELSRRLGVGRHGMRAMRRAGLKVRRIANRTFILGSDVLAFLAEQPAGAPATTGDKDV